MEITQYISAKREFMHNKREHSNRMACLIAYKTAELMAVGVNNPRAFPDSVKKAFPFVFGEGAAASGGIPVDDWRRSKEQMQEYQRAYRKGCSK